MVPTSQLKCAERAVASIREHRELPLDSAEVIEGILEAIRIVERRLPILESAGHKPPTEDRGR
jgi:hypothetical protein